MFNNKGFSLIEMVLVLILVAILTVSAAPAVNQIIYNSWDTARKHDVNIILSSIQITYANRMMNDSSSGYPTTLDSAGAGDCDGGNICFDLISIDTQELGDACDWAKVNATTYTCDTGPSTFTYTYDSNDGSFEQTGEVFNL